MSANQFDGSMRIGFWAIGLLLGVWLAYADRFFINTDGLIYIEMGEGLRTGEFYKLVNLACSPLYPMILGFLQIILKPDPILELPLLKIGGVLGLILAMFSCEVFLRALKKARLLPEGNDAAYSAVRAITYCLCLIATLIWIKVRLVNPDIFVFAMVLFISSVMVWIWIEPSPYYKYVLLGLLIGLGYLTKTYVFVLAPVFLITAALGAGVSWRILPRIMVAALSIMLVAAPLIIPLSHRVGRFSFGEVANMAYTSEVCAQGTPINKPEVLFERPRTLAFHYGAPCTDSMGFDIAYWSLGLSAKVDYRNQIKALWINVTELFGHTSFLLLCLGAWIVILWRLRLLSFPHPRHRKLPLLLVFVGACGTGLFALVHLEMRYVAPFVFVSLAGLLLYPSYPVNSGDWPRPARISTIALAAILLGFLVYGAIDQAQRGLGSSPGKPSFAATYKDFIKIGDFLREKGINPGDKVGILGCRPTYWARMARVQVLARIPDEAEFLTASASSRLSAMKSLERVKIRAVLAKGADYNRFTSEGWTLVPGTQDYYLLFP
jgi:hypothetical protein